MCTVFSLLFSLPGILFPLFLVLTTLHIDDPETAACYSNKAVHCEISTFLATGQLSGFQYFATVIITAKDINHMHPVISTVKKKKKPPQFQGKITKRDYTKMNLYVFPSFLSCPKVYDFHYHMFKFNMI